MSEGTRIRGAEAGGRRGCSCRQERGWLEARYLLFQGGRIVCAHAAHGWPLGPTSLSVGLVCRGISRPLADQTVVFAKS